MYHAETDTPAMARTSNLNEELGQVSCVSMFPGKVTECLMVHIDFWKSISGCRDNYQCLRNYVHAHVLFFSFHFKNKSNICTCTCTIWIDDYFVFLNASDQ